MKLPKDKRTLYIIGAVAVGLALITLMKKKTAESSAEQARKAEEESTYTTKPGEIPAVGDTTASLNQELAAGLQTLREEQAKEREGFTKENQEEKKLTEHANKEAEAARRHAKADEKKLVTIGAAIKGLEHHNSSGRNHKTRTRKVKRPR